jgi:mono/diheme cytochrome c family protein
MNINTRMKPIQILLGLFLLLTTSAIAQPDGKKLFKTNCAACHYASEKKLVGPGLKGVEQRWPDRAKLYAWIRNSQEFLKTGDAYAVKLFNDYNKSVMSAFPDLKDEEIDAILAYANNPDDGKAVAASAAGAAAGDVAAPAEPNDQNAIIIVLAFITVLLIILGFVLRSISKSLEALLNEKKGIVVIEGEPLPFKYQFAQWINDNKALVAIFIIVVSIGSLKFVYDGLMNVGVYQGYAPEQPIKFSHKIHAGQNGIACVYCHVGVEKSKHAVIPSANICMNCHKAVQEGPTYGREEIAKIYAALDYNPETQTYGNNPKPIKWIKIHNLPDHVYFNHAQHVKAGGVECTTCHGEIKEMEVVQQHSPLTMGWCINCHRETPVKYEENGYYKEFHARLNEELKSKYMKDGKVTVSEIGGLECAKCHY